VLGHQYLQFDESTEKGEIDYEAAVFLGWDDFKRPGSHSATDFSARPELISADCHAQYVLEFRG